MIRRPKIATYLYTVLSEEELESELKIILKRTKLGDTSQKQIAKKLSQWVQYIPEKTLNILISEPDISMKYLLETAYIKHSATNHHIYISSVVGYLTHLFPTCTKINKWKEIQKENWEPLSEHYLDNKPTELQKDKEIEYEEIMQCLTKLERGTFERLLLSFYILIEPIRADYYATEIISNGETSTEDNYIILSETEGVIYVNDFKTKGRHDAIQNKITGLLLDELKISLKKHPRRYLFVMDDKKTPFTRKLFSNWACRTLTRIFKKQMTLTVLRHAFITHKLKNKTSNIKFSSC